MIQILFACVVVFMAAPLYAEDGDPNRLAFESASKLDGEAYAVARADLESKGQAIVSLLREKSKSEDWRESFLADALLFRIERPVVAAQLRWALILPAKKKAEVDVHGNFFWEIPFRFIAIAKEKGEDLAAGRVVFSRESLPIVVDCLREFSGGKRRINRSQLYRNTLVVIEHLNPPLAAEPLIHLLLEYNDRPPVEIFVRMGETVIPALHKTLVEGLQQAHRKRAELVAKILGEMGNQKSGALLIESLGEVQPSDTTAVFCNAIAKLKATGAAKAIFDCLARNGSDDVTRSKRLDYKDYLSVREDLLSLADASKVLLANSGADVPQGIRSITGGMLFELENSEKVTELKKQGTYGLKSAFLLPNVTPDSGLEDIMAPLVIELAVAGGSRDLNHFKKLKGNEDAFQTLGWMLNRGNPTAILPLAELGGERALGFYRKEIEKMKLDLAMDDLMIEGAILIGAASSDFLDELAEALSDYRHEEKVLMVSQIAQQLHRDADDLAPLLEKVKDEKYRFLIARMMAEKDDLRSIPLLLEYMQSAEDWGNARRKGRGRRPVLSRSKMSQASIVSMGEPAADAIKAAAKSSSGKYAALFAESLILRIQNPELAKNTDSMLRVRLGKLMNVVGPSRSDFEVAGKRAAEQVGVEAVPLLEADVALSIVLGGPRSLSVAAFALGELKQERSLAVIVDWAQFPIVSSKGKPVAGGILEKFGPKGIEAAKKLEAINPSGGSR